MCTYLNGNLVAYTGQLPDYLAGDSSLALAPKKRSRQKNMKAKTTPKPIASLYAFLPVALQTSCKIGMLKSASRLLSWVEQDYPFRYHGSRRNLGRKPRNHIKFVRHQTPNIQFN